MERYGLQGCGQELMASYLQVKRQIIVTGVQKSKIKEVNKGIGISSVLGPLYFILYIDDLTKNLRGRHLVINADDTTTVVGRNSKGELRSSVEDIYSGAQIWYTYELALDGTKTKTRLTVQRGKI